jgi:hypothetical protein
MTNFILAGCPTTTQSWWLLVPETIYTVFALFLTVRPDVITADWGHSRKRLAAVAMVLVGAFFMFMSIYTGLTGHCLGTDLDSK